MRHGWCTGLGSLVQSSIERVQLWRQIARHVEPPVADEDGLTELGTVWAEERGLSPINVTIMPTCQ